MAAEARARREARAAALLAFLLPALFTGGAVVMVARPSLPGIPGGGDPPAALARLAGQPSGEARALRPLAAEPGRAGLEPESLESLEGGIRPAPPVRISIPAAGINDPVEPVRERDGGIEVPAVGRAGWFSAGPRPGEPGRSVMIGHLDSGTGPGLFAKVPSLPPGTRISVLDSRGDLHRYNVVGGSQVAKESFPSHLVYGPSQAPVLVLITCGGPFEPGRGYRDNVLLYARAA